jgi:hypothetical protein
MAHQMLRARMRLKRKSLQWISNSRNFTTSIRASEQPAGVVAEVIDDYSKNEVFAAFDPRIKTIEGHYFNYRNVFRLKNVLLEPRQGLVYDNNGRLVKESTCWSSEKIFASFPWTPRYISRLAELDKAVFVTSNSFWHWLIEDLATTILSIEKDPDAPIVVAHNPPKYVCDFLELQSRSVIFLKGPIRLKSLVMVEKRQDSGWPHPEDLKTVLAYKPFCDARDPSDPVNKVYISRKNSRRSPKNEIQIEEYFASIGFQIVELEKLNLIEEIKLISSVKVLAGIHGAGLANQIWMKEGGMVIDIVNEEYWTESIFRLAALSKNRYIPIPFKLNAKGEVPLAAIFQSVNDCL